MPIVPLIYRKENRYALRNECPCQTVCVRSKKPLTLISNNKSDHHDMTEMLLIVTLSTINEAIIYFRPVMLATDMHYVMNVMFILQSRYIGKDSL
jgi:hypothetical protein